MLPVYLIHFESPGWLGSSVDTIRRSEPAVSLTVVDNGGLPPMDDLRVVRPAANVGYTGGANIGLREWLAGEEPYAVVGAHDLLVEPRTLARMVALMDSRRDVGVLGPDFDEDPRSEGFAERPWIPGACLLLRRECIDAVGLFDERLGSYVEDVDLCYRATDGGWKVGIALGARARMIGHALDTDRRRALIDINWIFLLAKRGQWRTAFNRWIYQLVAMARRPREWRRRLEAFVLAPWKLRLLRRSG
jgi:GT2 family glycosyltransferase